MAQRIEIEVTQGNLNNNHLYLRRHLDFFPVDAVGPANSDDGHGRLLTLYFEGLEDPVTTDIAGGNKLYLRDRASWCQFYAKHRLRAGDRVTIERTGEYEYAISSHRVAGQPDLQLRHPAPISPPERLSASAAAAASPTEARVGRFAEFREKIAALRPPLTVSEALRREFLIEREGSLEIYYAPMDWVRPAAKVIIVGITPGKETMKVALETAAAGLQAGEPEPVFLDRVKSRASFSGMRKQLITWLDELDLHAHLGLDSCAALWTTGAERLVHPTSSARYPVLKDGANYSGSSPSIVQSPMLRRYVDGVLSEELAQVPEALIVPLGKRVDEALSWLVGRRAVHSARILSGFPHPSGANGHRHRQWEENGERLRRQTDRWFN
jgi:hypothetical protein